MIGANIIFVEKANCVDFRIFAIKKEHSRTHNHANGSRNRTRFALRLEEWDTIPDGTGKSKTVYNV
jgi:hypothetical protein